MMLTGKEIKKRLNKDIYISCFHEKRLNPNSYNLRLAKKLLVYDNYILDMKKENSVKEITILENGLILRPGKLYLGMTCEYTATYNLVPVLSGRSSIGRLGISIHVTAGFGDIGFCGHWTLEISCIQPVKIYPFIEICQIYYHEINGDDSIKYNGKYQMNNGIQQSLIYKEL